MPIRIDKTRLSSERIRQATREIAKTCFWDYHMSAEKILEIAREGTEQEKLWLVRRIIENCQEVIYLAWFFDQDELINLLNQIDIDNLRFRSAVKNLASLRSILGGKPVPPEIYGLTWEKTHGNIQRDPRGKVCMSPINR